jgi:hypothetical protein
MKKIGFLLLSVLFSTCVFAADAPKPEEAPATAGPAAPWAETQTRMLVYKSQRQQLMGEMKSLRAEQNQLKMGTPDMKNKGIEIVTKYKEYREITEEYNKLLVLLRYRYPERLAKEALKNHKTEEVPELDELTTQMDLDARLSISVNRARSLYSAPASSDAVDSRAPSSVPTEAEKAAIESPNLRESLPIEIRK